MGSGRVRAVSMLGAAVGLAIGLLLLVLMWRDALQYRDESGEGNALLLALIATGVVMPCCLSLAVTMANPSTRSHNRWTWTALVVGTSAACAAWMSAAVHG